MKTNNNTILMLLLFTSLIFNTKTFAQKNNEELIDDSLTTVNSDLSVISTSDNCNFVIKLDEIEIILTKNKKNETESTKTNNAVASNTISELEDAFCKLFRQFNQSNKVMYPFAVSITKRFIGDSKCPEICIKVDNNLVYTFKLIPNDSYLYAAVQESNKRLKEYYSRNKQLYAGK